MDCAHVDSTLHENDCRQVAPRDDTLSIDITFVDDQTIGHVNGPVAPQVPCPTGMTAIPTAATPAAVAAAPQGVCTITPKTEAGIKTYRHNPYAHVTRDYFDPNRIIRTPFFVVRDDVQLLWQLLNNPCFIPDAPIDLDTWRRLCRLAEFFKLPVPVIRLFLGQLPTRNLTVIRQGLEDVLSPLKINVFVIDVLKEGSRGNCAKIVVRASLAPIVAELLNHRFQLVETHQLHPDGTWQCCGVHGELLQFADPAARCVTCEPERSAL